MMSLRDELLEEESSMARDILQDALEDEDITRGEVVERLRDVGCSAFASTIEEADDGRYQAILQQYGRDD